MSNGAQLREGRNSGGPVGGLHLAVTVLAAVALGALAILSTNAAGVWVLTAHGRRS